MATPSPRPRPHEQPPDHSSWVARVRRGMRTALAGVIAAGASYLGVCVFVLLLYVVVFPPITGVQLQRRVAASFADGSYEHRYHPRPLSQIDPDLLRAVVAGEDSRFFEHSGIDWEAVSTAVREYRRGGHLRGASSISQQLVKNLFLTTHSTVVRKALEVPLTYAAELLLSKRRILELYVNVIEWGPGVYGAEAAAQFHYGSTARTLTRAQAAALAACIPNPLERRPDRVDWYQHIILRRMSNLGRLPLSYGTIQVPSDRFASASNVNRAR